MDMVRRCRVTVWNWRNEIVAEFGSLDEALKCLCADPELKANCVIEVRTLKYAL